MSWRCFPQFSIHFPPKMQCHLTKSLWKKHPSKAPVSLSLQLVNPTASSSVRVLENTWTWYKACFQSFNNQLLLIACHDMFHLHVCDVTLKLKSTVWVVWTSTYSYWPAWLPNYLENMHILPTSWKVEVVTSGRYLVVMLKFSWPFT